ncbi:hypothetical protein EG68_08283 [Paragonimus skrjabini miyazakii]|uniref:Uncharacterized protein n=1 Tax=Paragonimus skrjabini miyazakii TaxID=59628 RepID=A0A8S9YMD8_9TREM|nr:hypothetical protein EG68_08283 [Paragonimus skrjabini miyazakii]
MKIQLTPVTAQVCESFDYIPYYFRHSCGELSEREKCDFPTLFTNNKSSVILCIPFGSTEGTGLNWIPEERHAWLRQH